MLATMPQSERRPCYRRPRACDLKTGNPGNYKFKFPTELQFHVWLLLRRNDDSY